MNISYGPKGCMSGNIGILIIFSLFFFLYFFFLHVIQGSIIEISNNKQHFSVGIQRL